MAISSRKHTLESNPKPELDRFDTTPQGSDEWWARRKDMFSGSKIANLHFLKNQDERQIYWEEVFGIRKRPPLDDEALKRCKYGKDHEEDGVNELLRNVPGVSMWEIGFEQHPNAFHCQWFGSSPDGVIYAPGIMPDSPWGALEIKCSTKKGRDGKTVPHAGVPAYYMGQMHAEMKCMPLPRPCTWTMFVSWSETRCKCYIVKYNTHFWDLMWDVAVEFACANSSWESFSTKRDAMVNDIFANKKQLKKF